MAFRSSFRRPVEKWKLCSRLSETTILEGWGCPISDIFRQVFQHPPQEHPRTIFLQIPGPSGVHLGSPFEHFCRHFCRPFSRSIFGIIFGAQGGRGAGGSGATYPLQGRSGSFRKGDLIRLRQSSGLARRILRATPPAAGPPISSNRFTACESSVVHIQYMLFSRYADYGCLLGF